MPPKRSISTAPTRWSVSAMYRISLLGTSRAVCRVPPCAPISTSVSEKWAFSDASTMLQPAARTTPAPMAAPLIAPMTGRGQRRMASKHERDTSDRAICISVVLAASSRVSAPAQNIFPSPVSMMHLAST